jgi:hypothetical protein
MDDRDNEEDSGLITSDSDFEVAAQEAGHLQHLKHANPRDPLNLRKDVSKTFKKMLSANHNRSHLLDSRAPLEQS